ncbi:MAG: ribosome maturation factor RimM [Clostridia bacterium]|nr:ribosome maturation factor RimM [Clostridia bacterium]
MTEVMQIVNTHGVKGEMKALYFADSPEFFKQVPTLYDKNGRAFKITPLREHKGALLINIDGIDDMNKAEALKGTSLFAKREDFPALPAGEYYLTDLIGLAAVEKDGGEIGKVINISENAAQNLLVIEKPDGTTVLVPNCDAFVEKVDLDEKTIIITPIEGLL